MKAIVTANYEQLETLTEEKLTKAIAAQMYELSVLKDFTFDCTVDLMSILNPTSKKPTDPKKRDD